MTEIGTHILLVACRDEAGFFRFPNGSVTHGFGLSIEIVHGFSEEMQITQIVEQHLDRGGLHGAVKILACFKDSLVAEDGRFCTLFVATLAESSGFIAPSSWMTLPDILRMMPKDRSRLPYMKAMQVLAGAQDEGMTVVELDEAMRERLSRHLRESSGKSD